MDTELEFGNLDKLSQDNSGWVVGFPEARIGNSRLRLVPAPAHAHGPHIKWQQHQPGDPNGKNKPVSSGRTLSTLVGADGHFRLRFSREVGFAPEMTTTVDLLRCGDYVLWGPGWHHEWEVLQSSRIMSVRWEMVSPKD